MASGRPIATVLADARAGKPLSGSEWRLLAFYSWDTDEGAQSVAKADRAPYRLLQASFINRLPRFSPR